MKPYPYLTWSPPQTKGPLPVLLCLHGSGECGTDLERVAQQGPLAETRAGRALPFLLIAPQTREEIWNPIRLCITLDKAIIPYRYNPRRISITGYSMGGDGTWALAMHAPERFAAIAPLCGGGDVSKVKRLLSMPIWNFHGDRDWVVSLSESQALLKELARLGARKVRSTIYPNVGHDIWTRTYKNPAIYQWLASQERHAPKQGTR